MHHDSVGSDAPLRVAINAELVQGTSIGGIESFVIGLVHALGRLTDANEEYVVITSWRDPRWIEPYLGPNQRIEVLPSPPEPPPPSPPPPRRLDALKRLLGPLRRPLGAMYRMLLSTPPPPLPPPQSTSSEWPQVPMSGGFYESLGCDVLHFPYQSFVFCALPTIYNPHDLQHRHYPEYFPLEKLARRETIWKFACQYAYNVVVGSRWIKEDVVRQYGVAGEKVQVVPSAPPTFAYAEPTESVLKDTRAKYGLREPYALYPAITWPHKNHVRLLQALARLRDRDHLIVRLVCTGGRLDRYWPQVEAALRDLRLEEQVQFLDWVPPEELRALYHMAQFLVVPTLFEEQSQPIFEGWHDGVPVACSTATSLPDQVGDAALLFDPFSVEDMASAIRRMAGSEDLRADLIRKGRERLRVFSWERTAKCYRAIYRRAAKRQLTDEDRKLLAWDWMIEPEPHTSHEKQEGPA